MKFIVVDTLQNLAKGKPSEYSHLIVKRRLKIIESFDRFYDEKADLLEMGCGNGASLSLIHNRFNSCHGIDISKKHLKKFQDIIIKNRITNCTFSCSDIEKGSSVDKEFDRIICFDVLEHVKNDFHAIEIMFKTLKPNSKIAISIPNKWWIFETHGAYLPLLPWNRVPFFSWLPKSIHDKYAKATLKHIRIHDVSLGSDHKSSEVIITLDDGEQKKDFVISNNDIREIE